jgi:hypothetical protein
MAPCWWAVAQVHAGALLGGAPVDQRLYAGVAAAVYFGNETARPSCAFMM